MCLAWLSAWLAFPWVMVAFQNSGAQASLQLHCVYFLENPGNPSTVLVWFVAPPKFMCWKPVVSVSVLTSDQIMKALTSWMSWRHYHKRVTHCLDHLVSSNMFWCVMLWKGPHQLPDFGLQNGEICISLLHNLATLGYPVITTSRSKEPHATLPTPHPQYP